MAASSSSVFGKYHRFFSRAPAGYLCLSEQRDDQERDFLSMLPDELLHRIIQAIDHPTDRINLALASRHFFYLITENTPILSGKNLSGMVQLRHFMKKNNGLDDRDLLEIKKLLKAFGITKQDYVLPEMIRFARSFFHENSLREKRAMRSIFFDDIDKAKGFRTINDRFLTVENNLRTGILFMCIPGLLFLTMLVFLHLITANSFMLSMFITLIPLVLICYRLHTRIAYACCSDTNSPLYTDLRQVDDMQESHRDIFQAYFPGYQDNAEPLYQSVSRYIQDILYPTFFDKRIQPDRDVVMQPELDIIIEDNVTLPASQSDSQEEEPECVSNYNLFGDHDSDSEEYESSPGYGTLL